MAVLWHSVSHTCGSKTASCLSVDRATRPSGNSRNIVTPNSTVYASQQSQAVWIRVQGKGTFQISAGLKEYARRMILRGSRNFVVDLESCEIMDSTFMGTLAGIALRLREVGSGGLSVIEPNMRNLQLLENLGLDHLFSFDLPEGVLAVPYEREAGSVIASKSEPALPGEQQKTMIDAHEALVKVSPANEEKFKDVIELLKNEPSLDSQDA